MFLSTVMVCITSKTIIIVGQFCVFRTHAAGCDYCQYVSRADAAGRNYFESYRVNYTNKHYLRSLSSTSTNDIR